MTNVLEFESGGVSVQIVADENPPKGASQKASTGGAATAVAKVKSSLGLEDATRVVGELADAFSKALADTASKPSTVEVNFGLEASGEFGNFLISKLSGKANFSVKLSWKFD
jgi:hypothetical protein